MSFFRSWKSHYLGGYLWGLTLLGTPARIRDAIERLDRWAYDREWRQNLKSNTPNAELSAHQLKEAMAWGAGARGAVSLDATYPSPPYPEGSEWGV